METIFFIDLVKTSSVETDIRQLFKNDLTLKPNKVFTIFLNVLKRYDAERAFNPLRTSLLFKYETALSDKHMINKIVIHEESYTSKCDFLAFEKIGKHENYLGKRKNRGLFQSSVGKLINADVNGALNIMRKVVGDSCESIRRIIDRGLLFNPVRITNVFC